MEPAARKTMKVCGKEYSLWPQFVERKDEFIGGKLEDLSESPAAETEITDITFADASGPVFCIHGKDFDCSFNVNYGFIAANGAPVKGQLTFGTRFGMTFRITTHL